MAENILCSILEADKLEFHKVLSYQSLISSRKNMNNGT